VLALLSAARAAAAGPDLFGYRSLRSADVGGPSFLPFVDISTTGARLFFVDPDDGVTPNADDGIALDVPLAALNGGRGFPFYGTFHTTVAMSTNGILDFAPSPASDVPNNHCPLPDPTVPNTIIAVLWDDLVLANAPDPARGGYVQAFATCPYAEGGAGACVVFQWHRADHLTGSTDAFSLQAALYEDGDILMKFTAGNLEEGINSTTGIEAGAGLGVTDACDLAASITADSAVLFVAPPFVGATVGEAEPNDAAATATPISAGACGAGSIEGAGDADVWSLEATGTLLYAVVDTRFAAPAEFFSGNIRSNSELEPLGCLGDLGWYCLRFALWAMSYQLPHRVTGRFLRQAGRHDSPAPVPVEFSGELFFEGDVSAGFYCSFMAEFQQWVHVAGAEGSIYLSDFVLPNHGAELAFELSQPCYHIAGCDFRMEPGTRRITISEHSHGHASAQESNLFRTFAEQVRSGRLDETWPDIAWKTQRIVEACLESARHEGKALAIGL